MLNTTVLGKYKINKQVRENDLVVEYWGRDTQTDRDATVIAIQANLVSAADFFSRYESLTTKLSNLKSKYAATLIEFGEASGQALIVHEHVNGLSLSGMLANAGNGLPVDVAIDVAQQLGEYLEALHQSGLTQIVFDADDVFLSAENAVQVTNFGIAQGLNLGGLLSANKIQTRLSYAPELFKGAQADARTDFYSLGVLLFEVLTGKKININSDAADKTLIEDFFPSRLRMEISTEWDVLIAKCLHPNPAKRIQSAVEFLNQVSEIRHAMTTRASDHPLSMEDSLVGQTLGAYRLVSRLGQGGMATVYKSYEPALDRYVAIKVLPQFFAQDPVFVQRFRREAKAVAQLNHPNIVPIYSYGESGSITYIAMQFVLGDTLKHDDQKFSFEESLRLLAPIARALGYAHQRGIVHRDVKPSNILLTDGNWPMLADFGLAQMAQASGKLTESGVGMGTPMYMSPEQGQGDKVDHRTDIYSLGIVLYELVTGDVPFRADTPMAIVIKHISAPMPMPRQVNPNIPEYLEAIILKATAKNPDVRYQTAEEMATAMDDALSRVSSSVPIAAPPNLPPVVIQKPALESKPEVRVAAQPSASKKNLRVGIFSIAGILGMICLGVAAIGFFKTCPQILPWCAASPTQLPEVVEAPSTPAPVATDESTSIPVVTDEPTLIPVVLAGAMLDNFESVSPKGRTDWEFYFEDNKDTKLDCFVDDSREWRDSNYLQFQFDVAENSWATCGFYFDSIQDWSAGTGVSFYLRSDQPNAEYQIELFGGTPDARTTYVYWTATPSNSVGNWVQINIPWSKILRADWEENPGAVFDPTVVTSFVFSISTDVGVRQSGTLWIDDLQLIP